MRISERLQDFLTAYCSTEEDLMEAKEIIRSSDSTTFRDWLIPEMKVAVRERLLSSAEAQYLTGRGFESPADVAAWLDEVRVTLFGR